MKIRHWSERYIGQAYAPVENDCAALAARVQREVFRRDVQLTAERAHGLRGQALQIDTLAGDYATPTTTPADGDAVLMRARGRLTHVGVHCVIQGEAWVLHAVRNMGQVVLTRARELPALGLAVEGYYRWK